jgi:hypothetical protein
MEISASCPQPHHSVIDRVSQVALGDPYGRWRERGGCLRPPVNRGRPPEWLTGHRIDIVLDLTDAASRSPSPLPVRALAHERISERCSLPTDPGPSNPPTARDTFAPAEGQLPYPLQCGRLHQILIEPAPPARGPFHAFQKERSIVSRRRPCRTSFRMTSAHRSPASTSSRSRFAKQLFSTRWQGAGT